MRGWLLAQPSPGAVDAALARSLTNSYAVMVRVAMESRFPESGPSYQVVASCHVESREGADLAGALAQVEGALTGPTSRDAEGWITMLAAGTIRRPDSEASAAATLTLYSRTLMDYPADVGKAVCMDLVRSSKWFPALAELVEKCERLAGPRRAMRHAVMQYDAARVIRPFMRSPMSEEEREQARRFLEAARARRADMERQRMRPPIRPTHGETDEGGLTAAMREHMARQSAREAA